MTFPDPIYDPVVQARKARLARRRSNLIWPERDLSLKTRVRIEARVALISSVSMNWSCYRRSKNPTAKAQYRSYMRAQITAIRILTLA